MQRFTENDINISLRSTFVACFEATHECEAFDEMARDEARHGKAFEGLLKRYFG